MNLASSGSVTVLASPIGVICRIRLQLLMRYPDLTFSLVLYFNVSQGTLKWLYPRPRKPAPLATT